MSLLDHASDGERTTAKDSPNTSGRAAVAAGDRVVPSVLFGHGLPVGETAVYAVKAGYWVAAVEHDHPQLERAFGQRPRGIAQAPTV